MNSDDLTIEVVLAAMKEHGSQRWAARSLHTAVPNIARILRQHSLVNTSNQRNLSVTPQVAKEAFDRLGNAVAAARELGVSPGSVLSRLREIGIMIGKGNNPPQKLPMTEIIARYEAGESTLQIAKTFAVDDEVIRRRLNRRGIQLRPPGGWSLLGKKNHQWKGKGQTYKDGKYQARKTYLSLIGKQPLPGTVIHHMDENTSNNDADNLWTFPNNSCHSRFHQRLLNLQRQGLSADANQIALENGGVPLRRILDPTAALPSISPPDPFGKPATTEQPRT